MKKLLLVISLLSPLMFSFVRVSNVKAEDNNENECNSEKSIVRIVDNYNVFKNNGIVYKVDDTYNYIITSSKFLSNVNSYSVIYENNINRKATLLGVEKDYEIAVFKTEKVENITKACTANGEYLYKGQISYLNGYTSLEVKTKITTNLIGIGELVYNNEYKNIFKNVLQLNGNNDINGIGVFDELNRLTGIVNGFNETMSGTSYMIDVNRLIKIADSVVKTGNYEINYIKYNVVDYGTLSSGLKKSYNVSNAINYGAVITTFKPLNYIFGGLNQGMVIVAVNGIEIKSVYELDKQLSRYEKEDNVCLKVIKKNGKEAFYYVEI